MSRYRRKRGGGGGGGGSVMQNKWGGYMAIVFGTIALLITLIMYGIALSNLDTAYTSAATYTEQVGLTSIMGIWPLVLFIIFMTAGLAAITGGTVMNWKKTSGGGWMDVFMGLILGTVGIVIAILMNTTIQSQLHSAYVAANASTNIASFSGLLSTMTIFGMVIFLSLMAAGTSHILAAGYGGYKHLSGKV